MPMSESIPNDKSSASELKVAPRPRSNSFQKLTNFVKSIPALIFGKDEPKYEAFEKEEPINSSSSNTDLMETDSNNTDSNNRGIPAIVEYGETTMEYFEAANDFIPIADLKNPKYITSMSQQPSELNKIGEGGFSIVRKEEIAGCIFAVKYFKGGRSTEEIATAYKEAKLLANLKHDNVVKYIGIKNLSQNAKESLPFGLVMELCDSSLHTLIHSGGNISPQQELSILNQIAAGLEYLHGMKIVHRDIKPKNILLRKNGTIAIADFGVAKRSYESRETTSTGDIYYSPPECFIDDKYSSKTDVWSFGVIMWELLTKKEPFKGIPSLSFGAKLAAKTIKLALPESTVAQRPEINALMEECLNYDDEKRPSFTSIRGKLAFCK